MAVDDLMFDQVQDAYLGTLHPKKDQEELRRAYSLRLAGEVSTEKDLLTNAVSIERYLKDGSIAAAPRVVNQ